MGIGYSTYSQFPSILQIQSDSNSHILEQPSPLIWLPSSHYSKIDNNPSPQAFIQIFSERIYPESQL